jgi:hypothetical protein
VGAVGTRSANKNEFSWLPTLQFSNVTESHIVVEHYSYDEENGVAFCMYDFVVKVRMTVELHRFPFDRHKLHFAFKANCNVTLWQNNEVEALPTFSVQEDPFRLGLKDEAWMVSNVQFLERVKAYKKGYRVMVWASRNPLYYILNYLSVYFALVIMAFTTYAVPRTDFGARAGVSLTLLLITVAFRFVVNANVPSTTYLTLLDVYGLIAKSFIGIVVLENYTAATCTSCSDSSEQSFFAVFFSLWIGFHGLILIGAIMGWLSLPWDVVRDRQNAEGNHYVSNEPGTFHLDGEIIDKAV